MKLIDLINKDIKFENESKKVIVAIRVLYLVIFAAFILDLLYAGLTIFQHNTMGICLFFAALIVLFADTYYSRTRIVLWLFLIYVFSWSLFMIPILGWSAGMQNYIILVLMMVFFGSNEKFRYKIILSALVLLSRFVVIFMFGGTKPVDEVSWLTDKMLQVTNISAVFIAIIYISYTFSKEKQAEESKLVKYNYRLQKEANTDRLTGLYNRRRAEEYLAEIEETNTGDSVSVAIADIDFFKKVNDNYGHDVGDEVLKALAGIMTDTLRNDTFIARWGGEEFLIVFPSCNGDQASIALSRLRHAIKTAVIKVGNNEIKITMTFGLSEYDFSGSFDNTIKCADENLYRGKNSGRDQIVY
ncbi:MAG: GGDEF domain-containing protein [Lachnospiraceae bacterium]|nr:GGDEF domain-containing protein [Lachnospiraceae bacterium]